MAATSLAVLAGTQLVDDNTGTPTTGAVPTFNSSGKIRANGLVSAAGVGGLSYQLTLLHGRNDDGTVLDTTGTAVAVNQINSIPFVDSSGSGTFKITVEGCATGAITYNATAATLVSNINTALNATFGTSAIVASGATLAAIILTSSGTGYAGRVVGPIQANVITASTGYTINGVGTVGINSICAVTTAGVAAGTAGKFKLVNTTGTSLGLVSEGAKNNTKTCKVAFEWVVPQSYKAGDNLTATFNAKYTANGGTVTVSTVQVDAYLLANDGTSGATIGPGTTSTVLTTAADYPAVITGTTLTAGARALLELTAIITENANAGTGSAITVNSLRVG